MTRAKRPVEWSRDAGASKGRWRFGPHHDVQYVSDDLNEEITFQGALVAAEPGALLLSVTKKQADQKVITSIVKLTGAWKLNPKNQITFEIQKESGRKDVLVFEAGWKVNDRHEIIYSWETQRLKRKTKETRELVFKGHYLSGRQAPRP